METCQAELTAAADGSPSLVLDKLSSDIAVNQCQVQYQARPVTVRGLDPVHSSAGDEEEQEGKKQRKVTSDMWGGKRTSGFPHPQNKIQLIS